MANPQPTDAHLRIAHSIQEQIMVSDFTEQQRRVLDLILRLSWGCGKKYAIIPKQSDFQVIGVPENKIKAHLDWLVNAKVIFREGPLYEFNKNFDRWQVSRALYYNEQKMSELLHINLNENELDEKGRKLDEKGTLENQRFNSQLPKKGTEKFPIRELPTSQKGNFAMPELASAKESIKEREINSNTENIDNNLIFKTNDDFNFNQLEPKKAADIWVKCLDSLQEQISKSNYNTWIAGTSGLGLNQQRFFIGVQNQFTAKYLRENQFSLIEKTINEVTSSRYEVEFILTSKSERPAGESP